MNKDWYERVGAIHHKRWHDHPNLTDALLDKLIEETYETTEAVSDGFPIEDVRHELGDVLFVVAALAQHLGFSWRDIQVLSEEVFARNLAKWQ